MEFVNFYRRGFTQSEQINNLSAETMNSRRYANETQFISNGFNNDLPRPFVRELRAGARQRRDAGNKRLSFSNLSGNQR